MVRILVLSDTHIPHRARFLPPELNTLLERADVILHAGDFTSYDVLLELQAYGKPVHAVYGNMDDVDLARTLPEVKRFTLEGVTFALTHGSGARVGLEERVIQRVGPPVPRILVYGHSHRARILPRANTVLFNPGSATDTVYAKEQTYGWILIQPPEITLHIRTLPDHQIRQKHVLNLSGD
jgi:putative phosphoesterase